MIASDVSRIGKHSGRPLVLPALLASQAYRHDVAAGSRGHDIRLENRDYTPNALEDQHSRLTGCDLCPDTKDAVDNSRGDEHYHQERRCDIAPLPCHTVSDYPTIINFEDVRCAVLIGTRRLKIIAVCWTWRKRPERSNGMHEILAPIPQRSKRSLDAPIECACAEKCTAQVLCIIALGIQEA
jgi:hypothetical protein